MSERQKAMDALEKLRALAATGALNSDQHPHADRGTIKQNLDTLRAAIDKAYPPVSGEESRADRVRGVWVVEFTTDWRSWKRSPIGPLNGGFETREEAEAFTEDSGIGRVRFIENDKP